MIVSFEAGETTLRGHLYRPTGTGTHPAVLWNHGSEPDPGPPTAVARLFTAAGYVLFAPHRLGHGLSGGDYELGGIVARARSAKGGQGELHDRVMGLVIELQERRREDVAAAVSWLCAQAFVDRRRLAMAGVSHGGIQTLLAAEADLGPRRYIPFAPGAMAWDEHPELRERLLQAVRAAVTPIMLIQAENDFSLGPSESLGEVLREKGAPNASLVYPPYGSSRDSGHGGFAREGTDVWGDRVVAFLAG